MEILDHFNFRTKSMSEIFVFNAYVNLGKEHPRRRSKLDQLGLNCEHFVHLKIHYPGANQVDLILAQTEATFVLNWEKVTSRTRYVLYIGSVGFELGTMFTYLRV